LLELSDAHLVLHGVYIVAQSTRTPARSAGLSLPSVTVARPRARSTTLPR
jgi:hypothetical protein